MIFIRLEITSSSSKWQFTIGEMMLLPNRTVTTSYGHKSECSSLSGLELECNENNLLLEIAP